MDNKLIQFSLSFEGNETDGHQIDLYDASQALVGFQRTLALTTSLVLNGELITQAPSLKNATILASPPQEGSWKLVAAIVTGGYFLLTAPKDTLLGNLVYSAYDFVIKENLGFHPTLDESLLVQYEQFHQNKKDISPLNIAKLQSLSEKCQNSVRDIHRPIYAKGTASSAIIQYIHNESFKQVGPRLNRNTYENLIGLRQKTELECFIGRISSYDVNTQKGRIFLPELLRTIPFELDRDCLSIPQREKIIDSLKSYQQLKDKQSDAGFIKFNGYRITSFQNDIKKIFVVGMDDIILV